MLERVAEARAGRIAAGLPGGRPKTALGDKQVPHAHALRSAGYSVRQIVADLEISRASVYRTLNLLEVAGHETFEAESPD